MGTASATGDAFFRLLARHAAQALGARHAFAAESLGDRAARAAINDDTILRATATFLRTIVTRNTPFDRFLASDDGALSTNQRRGANLFFTR